MTVLDEGNTNESVPGLIPSDAKVSESGEDRHEWDPGAMPSSQGFMKRGFSTQAA